MSTVLHSSQNGKKAVTSPHPLDGPYPFAAQICCLLASAACQRKLAPSCMEITRLMSWRFGFPEIDRPKVYRAVRKTIQLLEERAWS